MRLEYKRVRVVGAPVRPLSSYFLWLQDNRGIFKRKYGDLGVIALARLMGKYWRNLSQSIKDSYIKKSNELLRNYELKVRKFKLEHGNRNVTSVIKKPLRHQSFSGYILFSRWERSHWNNIVDIPFRDYGHLLGKAWRSLSVDARKMWNLRALKIANKLQLGDKKEPLNALFYGDSK